MRLLIGLLFAWASIFRTRGISVRERISLRLRPSVTARVKLSILRPNKLIRIKSTGFNSVPVIVAVTIIPNSMLLLQPTHRGHLTLAFADK